jgi:hypothetical protein
LRIVFARWSRLYSETLPRLLVEALYQPARLGRAVRDEGLLLVGAGAGADARVIALVDQQPGQGLGIELDVPQPA